MRLWETFCFEAGYQARRVSTWLYFAVLLGITYVMATQAYIGNARRDGYFFNAPFVVAAVTVLCGVMALPVTAALAGDAATRDVQTRMHPLLYTTPVGRATYLAGRLLAAFALNALVLLAVPAGLLLTAWVPGPEPELLGPFRPAAYLDAYLLLALPTAFVATALLSSLAVLTRRALASYLGSALLFLAGVLSWQLLAGRLGHWELAKLVDPLGLTAMAELSRTGTPLDKNTRLVGPQASVVANRLVWLAVALGALALTHLRFRFTHPTTGGGPVRGVRRWGAHLAGSDAVAARGARVAVPRVARSFGFTARVRQTLAVAWESFREIVTGWGGLALGAVAAVQVLAGPQVMRHMGVPLIPTTGRVVGFLAAPLTDPGELVWMVVPLLIVFYAGELVWRERDAGLGEIADAAPVPEWVPFAGKLAGLGLVVLALQGLLVAAGVLIQALLGHRDFEIGVYLRVLLGLQLADYLLFAVLALVVHALVDHKYVGHLVVLAAYAFMAFAPALGVEHNLLVYASDPGWSYSDMRGFGPFPGPWFWFKLYWAGWALLLSVAARLLWVRGREPGFRQRLRGARRRLTPPAVGAAAGAAGLVLALGGFIFYNTDVLNHHRTAAERTERRAEYERRYGRFRDAAQPRLAGMVLRVEIHPARREAEIRGTYRLVNRSAAPIDSVHLDTSAEVETGAVGFDRPAARVLADEELGHRIYALAEPLRPGDSLRLSFTVRFRPRGFPDRGIDASVAANGTYFEQDWLPAIGYRAGRELDGAGERRAHGLPPRPAVRSLYDAAALRDVSGAERIAFEAVVGTDFGQVAVAPGRLLHTWTEGGRRYFHYATDAPIRGDFAFYSADYAVHEGRWNGVAIQVLHHPGHAWNLDRTIRSVQASLDYDTREFGPYPHGQIRLVEHPGPAISLHGSPVDVSYFEGFPLLNPEDPRELDFPFAVVAHEVAHQWWGNQLTPADVEGAPLLTESLAWYSAMGAVERTYGPGHLRRLLDLLRREYLMPHTRAGLPLLRAYDRFTAYRRGPFAMYALREYVGEARVNAALRRLLREHGSAEPPLATSLDLYRELRAVTPDSLRPLLHDLFEANTFWELETRRAGAERTTTGAWRVTLDVRARKVVVDSIGAEREVPMDDLVEVGVYAVGTAGGPGAPLYLRGHRVRSGEQRIVVTVPGRPGRAGIDPRGLLPDTEADDNLRSIR